MPDVYCRNCGTLAQPTDLFCRKCGSSISPLPEGELQAPPMQPEVGGLVGSSRVVRLPRLTAWAIGMGCFFVLCIVLAVLYIFSLAFRSDGLPAIAVKIAGPSTPYPTRRPYYTALPYDTSTPYPTAIPYPTTGPLATIAATPTGTGAQGVPFVPLLPSNPTMNTACELRVTNNFSNLDGVVVLARADTNVVVKAVYVRANDSVRVSGISTGTYYAYVTMGLDWDQQTGSFINYESKERFSDRFVYDSCSGFNVGTYGYEVTLNYSGAQGSDMVNVQPQDFPKLAP